MNALLIFLLLTQALICVGGDASKHAWFRATFHGIHEGGWRDIEDHHHDIAASSEVHRNNEHAAIIPDSIECPVCPTISIESRVMDGLISEITILAEPDACPGPARTTVAAAIAITGLVCFLALLALLMNKQGNTPPLLLMLC